ncbi:hypothetical protein HJG60_011097 [Phyllostomus discolor]|uniref:Uncharacterized protein n=1 Tax=Phyllostomus discolor TaxID=89673 RepID=A0A834A3D6_9CHIR|nr:hypothetical protein HJG60_011097 [Phyllostomus discolor]
MPLSPSCFWFCVTRVCPRSALASDLIACRRESKFIHHKHVPHPSSHHPSPACYPGAPRQSRGRKWTQFRWECVISFPPPRLHPGMVGRCHRTGGGSQCPWFTGRLCPPWGSTECGGLCFLFL